MAHKKLQTKHILMNFILAKLALQNEFMFVLNIHNGSHLHIEPFLLIYFRIQF